MRNLVRHLLVLAACGAPMWAQTCAGSATRDLTGFWDSYANGTVVASTGTLKQNPDNTVDGSWNGTAAIGHPNLMGTFLNGKFDGTSFTANFKITEVNVTASGSVTAALSQDANHLDGQLTGTNTFPDGSHHDISGPFHWVRVSGAALLAPSTVQLLGEENGKPVKDSSLTLYNCGGGPLTWQATATAATGNWLTLDPSSSTSPLTPGSAVMIGIVATPGTLKAKDGPFNGTVTVTAGNAASVTANVVFTLAVPQMLQVSPSALSLQAFFQGDSPPVQFINIAPTGPQPVSFGIAIDGGVDIPAPAWISINAGSIAGSVITGLAPARVEVTVHQGTLAAQSQAYQARIRVMDISGNTTIVPVTLTVVSPSPQLQVVPDTLHFTARVATPGKLTQILGVRNTGGGGPINFNTSVEGNSTWITGVRPASGQTVHDSTVLLNVDIDTTGLQVGSYRDVIEFSSNAGIIKVPVALFVSGDGAILGLSVTGIRFQARQGGGFSNPQTVEVLDVGDPASSLTWTAEFVSGSKFFSATPSSGAATQSNPGMLGLAPTPNALQMTPGGYYGLLKISSSQALNSPLYVVLVLDLESSTTPPLPDPFPAGLVFIATAGKPLSTGQVVNVNTSSATAVAFQANPVTADGGTWLNVMLSSQTATGQSPGVITVTVDPTKLAAGIYRGEVDISMSGVLRAVNIILIVLPSGTIAARAVPAASSCTPAKLAIAETALVNNFAVPAGWPAALTVQLYDDCGNAVPDASVTASFSNGDPPLMLRAGQSPTYSATWQPGVVSQQMTVTIQAQAGQFQPATAQFIGSINQNSNAPPVLSENGTVNVFNRLPAGALAPGMIIEVYGSGLATTKGNPGVLPLPTSFQGTSLIVGPEQAPLYFVSGGQLDVQVATELTPNQQYPVIAILNGALSVPVMADISPVQLGMAALADGHAIAQHGADSSYVDSNHPAKPGEVLVIYLSGMGPTNPSVKSGDPAPTSEPLARVTIQPTVTVDGQNGAVQFAGLTPGFVGLYQVNFQVPSNAKSGDLTLIVTQGGISSNATKLPVRQ